MNLKLKVCGMKFSENIGQVVALKPDYMGLIFYEKSPRFVKEAIEVVDPSVKKTGVFVNASEESISEKVHNYDLAAVQLHGDESPEFCQSLRKNFSEAKRNMEIIKVFSVKEHFDFRLLEPYEKNVDLFLFDTKGQNHGGNGIVFDWQLLEEYPSSTPFFLSGGIGPGQVGAIREFHANLQKKGKENAFYGVDVNSKFETSAGMKNIETLQNFRKELNA